MCFSSTASFAAAAVLLPAGCLAVARARQVEPAWWALATFPVVFGLQQAIEGTLWLAADRSDQALVQTCAQGFTFFSHFFWLLWVPFAVWVLEPVGPRRVGLLGLTALGAGLGAVLYMPSLAQPNWLEVEFVAHAVAYHFTFLTDGLLPRWFMDAAYGFVIFGALFLSSDARLHVFAGLLAVALGVTFGAFSYAMASVWCFFAAILSLYLVAVIGVAQKGTQRPWQAWQ